MKMFHRCIQFYLFAFPAILTLASPSSAGLLQISAHPIIAPSSATPTNRLPDYFYTLHPAVSDLVDYASVYHFLKDARSNLEGFAVPAAIWLQPAKPPGDSNRLWHKWLQQMLNPSMRSRIQRHRHAFEMGWFENEGAGEQTRRNFAHRVPPLILHAMNPAELLTLWHEVSGIDFLYDEDLVQKALHAPKPSNECDAYGFPIEYPDDPALLVPPPGMPIEDFMNLLAGKVGAIAWIEGSFWVIAPSTRNPYTIAKARRLLAEMKRSNYQHAHWQKGIDLARMGEAVLPEILSEYRTARGGYFLALTDLLDMIDCEERDRTFLSTLKDYLSNENTVTEEDAICSIVDTLSRVRCKKALPFIQDLARWEDFRVSCKIALNRLGQPLPASASGAGVTFKKETQALLEDERVQRVLPVIFAFLDQCFDASRKPGTVQNLEIREDGQVEFLWNSDKGMDFRLWIPAFQGERAVVHAMYWYDDLSAGGYRGRAIFSNGRWLFVDWRMMWIS